MPRETSGLTFGLQQLYHDIVLESDILTSIWEMNAMDWAIQDS